MQQPRPATLIAELSYQCPLHCPYCSNPLEIGHEKYRVQLETEHWTRTFGRHARWDAAARLTGGERCCAAIRRALLRRARRRSLLVVITAGVHLTRERAEELKAAGSTTCRSPFRARRGGERPHRGNRSFEKKIAAAHVVKELGFPLTINCVLHRQNLDRIGQVLDLALDLGAQRLELANTQYYGWAVPNQEALLPSWEQLRRAEEAVQRFRERVGPEVDVLWVLPDLYEDLPKPCMGGWGATAMVVAPNGDVLPCQRRPRSGLEFANVREHPLDGSGASRMRSRGSGGRTGCRSRAGRALGRQEGTSAEPLPALRLTATRGHRPGLPVLAAHDRSYRHASRRRRTSSSIARLSGRCALTARSAAMCGWMRPTATSRWCTHRRCGHESLPGGIAPASAASAACASRSSRSSREGWASIRQRRPKPMCQRSSTRRARRPRAPRRRRRPSSCVAHDVRVEDGPLEHKW